MFIRSGLCRRFPFVQPSFQPLPLLVEEQVQIPVTEITETFANQNDNIQASHTILLQTEGFPDMAFGPVSANGSTDIFLGNHQSQSCPAKLVNFRQDQELFAGYLDIRYIKYLFEISRGA